MSPQEWKVQWRRMDNQFKASSGADVDALSQEWFAQLKHYHVDAVEAGITTLIGQATDTFWPALGKLKQAIQTRISGLQRTKATCETCKGSSWVEATPWKNSGRVYTGFVRCPDCAVPPPIYQPNSHREELTASEFQAWRDGTFPEPAMPLSKPNHSALEALQYLNPKRGRMQRAIAGAPQTEREIA